METNPATAVELSRGGGQAWAAIRGISPTFLQDLTTLALAAMFSIGVRVVVVIKTHHFYS